MHVQKDDLLIVLRCSSFQKHSFIDEHNEIIKAKGSTWILKFGKEITNQALKKLMSHGAHVLFRLSKREGGEIYYSKIQECWNGRAKEGMEFPPYYYKAAECFEMDTIQGTWLKVSNIERVPQEYFPLFKLASNNRDLVAVLNETRTSVINVYCAGNIDIDEGK